MTVLKIYQNKNNVVSLDKIYLASEAENSLNANRINCILYTLLDAFIEEEVLYYKIQPINKSNIFMVKLEDLVFDTTILWGLTPFEASCVGIEYAAFFYNKKTAGGITKQPKISQYMRCRYGSYELLFQNRTGQLVFMHRSSLHYFMMVPEAIAFSKELIEEFDAAQAFYIGLLAGLKLNRLPRSTQKRVPLQTEYPHLHVIK